MKHFNITKRKRNQKWIAIFFLTIFLPSLVPVNALYAANNGPNAPEAASFEPVDASDMVSLATGDMAYVLPVLNVPSPEGGYPLVLSYHGGIGYDQESSMVGLGWNLNPGAINRNVNGAPDDWKNAKVRDWEHFESTYTGNQLSIGYGSSNFSAALGYSWDSNGTQKGALSVNVGSGSSSIGVGVGYSNQDGWSGDLNVGGIGVGFSNKGVKGSLSTGFGSSNGFGVSTYADTDGNMQINAHGNYGTGFSLSSSRGKVGVGLSVGGANHELTKTGSSNISSFGYNLAAYYYGFFIKYGHEKMSYSRDTQDDNYVYGPLYYSVLSNHPVPASPGNSYSTGVANQHNRDTYMDTYSEPVPQDILAFTTEESTFNEQKFSYNAPAYDYYEVNAQGLNGTITPRLATNGLLINRGVDIQTAETIDATPTCPCYSCCESCEDFSCLYHGCFDENKGFPVISKKLYVNSHYSMQQNHLFNNTFGSDNSTLNFYFNYQFPSELKVNALSIQNNGGNSVESFFSSEATAITSRKENSDFIETFTNEQITSAYASGRFLEAKGYDRINDSGYRAEGIGGYKITTADGKTYHYSRPVYQFEKIYRQLPTGVSQEDSNYREVRETVPYATHWLLTAITGPDFVKNSTSPYPDEGDYGYWVRFDYGKWTDGYVWRTPYSGYDNTNRNTELNVVQNEYSWGRKQLVYLDKIVTRTHTALFVKSLRDDDIGNPIGSGGYPTFDDDNNVLYASQKTLKLDQIILLKNSEYQNSVEPDSQITNLTDEQQSETVYWHSMSNIENITLNQQLEVLDSGDLLVDSNGKPIIYDKAIKIIKLNQSYDLAQNSPNSLATSTPNSTITNPSGGRLTLENVEILGKGGESYMMPYTFSYIGKEISYTTNQDDRDDWGYKKGNPMLWTLNQIQLPTNATIHFDYEEDEFYTEALSKNYFDVKTLKFRVVADGTGWRNVEFQNLNPYSALQIDFTKYFTTTDPAWGYLRICHDHPTTSVGNGGDTDWLNFLSGAAGLQVLSVTQTSVIFKVPYVPNNGNDPYNGWDGSLDDVTGNNTPPEFVGQGLNDSCYVNDNCSEGNGSDSSYHFNFRIVANKTPQSGYGGGIRVSKVSTSGDNGTICTEYNYNHPIKNRTSGITTYAPSMSTKYVAYRTEAPGPRVMYEYVTLAEKGINGEYLGKTQYQFDVVQPVLNIFDRNIQVGEHFKSTVNKTNNLNNGTTGIDIKLQDNFATVGNLLKVTQINKEGQIMSQVKNKYLTLAELADTSSGNSDKPGALQESFHSFTSFYDYTRSWMIGNPQIGPISWTATCPGIEHVTLNGRTANSSQKITYPVVQKIREEITATKKQITEFSKMDRKTGMFLVSKTSLADGTQIRTERTPAYTKYAEMGSKVDNPDNKNMLTQEAMNVTSILKNGQWNYLDANITTWKSSWAYRDEILGADTNPLSEKAVWRKNKFYKYKTPNLDADGAIIDIKEKQEGFDWVHGVPIDMHWKKIAEISRYNHFSSPIETKDINENFVSSKTADKDSKVIVSGNARYTEMYYTGAENVNSGNVFDGEVKGADFRTSELAHTGKYSVKAENINSKVFEVTGSSGATNYYQDQGTSASYSATFRPGRYKVSFWYSSLSNSCPSCKPTVPDPVDGTDTFGGPSLLHVNGNPIRLAEVVNAGCWQQLNYYFNIPTNETLNSIVVSPITYSESDYFDDFRMHPVSSTINSYVYNEHTDEVSYILDTNNMGTAYKYDNAGRLIATYVEDIGPVNEGGFKLIGQYKQNYINKLATAPNLSTRIQNCNINTDKLDVQITNKGLNSYTNKFTTVVTGGTGNYEYKYKWLVNYDTKLYSNYTDGGSEFDIPYVPKFCEYNSSTGSGIYAKDWDLKVKVKDLITNQEIERSYMYEGDCINVKKYNIEPSFEVDHKTQACSPDTFMFRVHLKDNGVSGNFKYEYAYYNPNQSFNTQLLNWVDITSGNGLFCPDYVKIQDANSKSGYRKAIYFTYRVTDLTSGEASIFYPNVFFGNDTPNGDNTPSAQGVSQDIEYQKAGNVLVKDTSGKITSFYNVFR